MVCVSGFLVFLVLLCVFWLPGYLTSGGRYLGLLLAPHLSSLWKTPNRAACLELSFMNYHLRLLFFPSLPRFSVGNIFNVILITNVMLVTYRT